MANLNIGVGGIPLSSKKYTTEDGIRRVKELGLDLMEMEFVQGVKLTADAAIRIAKVREEKGIELTVHGPYFVNLASLDNRIFYGSIKYVSDSIFIGGLAGAKSVTFHPAFYQSNSPEETFKLVKKGIEKIYETFDKPKFDGHPVRNNEIVIAPELTGKPTQFGDLEELIKLSQEFSNSHLKFCIDFAHKYARSNGQFNTYEDFVNIFNLVEKALGKEFLGNMHMHVSAINYGEKGEKNHLTFLGNYEDYLEYGIDIPELKSELEKLELKGKTTIKPGFNWQELLRAIKDKNVGGYLVCESPILELDALLLKQQFSKL